MSIDKNLNLVVNIRDNEKYSLAVAKNNKIIYKSKDRGILPLYLAYVQKLDFADAFVADKVVGLGAAMLLVDLNIKQLNTNIISSAAYNYLQDNNIVVVYGKLVEFIANRNGDGKCPIETIADNTNDIDMFLKGVEQFLKRLDLI